MNTRKTTFERLGSAFSQFVNPSSIPIRDQVTTEILKRSRIYSRQYKLTGSLHCEKKSKQLKRQAARYRTCGYEYSILKCRDCSRVYLGQLRCESRICESCAKKQYIKVIKKQTAVAKMLRPTKTKRLMHLVLTLKRDPNKELHQSDVKALNKYTRKLINKLYPKKKGSGAFSVTEVSDSLNLHVHALVYGRFYWQHQISDEWRKITGNSYVVHISEVRNYKTCLNYLLKYLIKSPDFENPEQIAIYLDAITGVRRIHTYGEFYNFPIMRKSPFKCYFCGGSLEFSGNDGGLDLPEKALLFSEARELAKRESVN